MLKVFNYPVRLTVSKLNCAAEPLRVVSALIRLVIFSSFFSLLVTFDSCNYDGLQHTRSFPPPPHLALCDSNQNSNYAGGEKTVDLLRSYYPTSQISFRCVKMCVSLRTERSEFECV